MIERTIPIPERVYEGTIKHIEELTEQLAEARKALLMLWDANATPGPEDNAILVRAVSDARAAKEVKDET